MKEYLKPTELKLSRVIKQVNDLNENIDNWISSDPIKFDVEISEDRLSFKIFVKEIKEPYILDQWGILVGEITHNLRSSLDNLIFALARLEKDPPDNPEQIQFPIFQEEIKFSNTKTKLLKYLKTDVVRLIEQFQPFQRLSPQNEGQPNTDPLVLLQYLNNIDKHRIPSIALLSPTNFEQSIKVYFHDTPSEKMSNIEIIGHPLTVGSVILNYKSIYRIKNIEGSGGYSVDIVIQGTSGFEQITQILQKLHWYISKILECFTKYFE